MATTTISRTSTAKATATTTEKTFNGLVYNTTIKIIKKILNTLSERNGGPLGKLAIIYHSRHTS